MKQMAFGVGLLAAATLLFESTLTRLLAVAQYYHFAFLVVSLALLGFGASGSYLTLVSSWKLSKLKTTKIDAEYGSFLVANASLGFSISVVLVYLVINIIPFDSYSITWDTRQVLYLIIYFIALAIPFLLAGIGIGGALAYSGMPTHLIYAFNLLGSGVGTLLAPGLLWLAGVPGGILASTILGLLATVLAGLRPLNFLFPAKWRLGRNWVYYLLLGIGVVSFGGITLFNLGNRASMGMVISPYKGLAHARRYPGSIIVFSRWNAFSRLDIIAEAGTRMLPGLSYSYPGIPPPQMGLSVDADSLQPLTLTQPGMFEAATYLPEAVAFLLRPQASVLLLEPAGGLGVLQSLAGGATHVTAVVSNPLLLYAITRSVPEYDIFRFPSVNTVVDSPRAYMARTDTNYLLVFLPLTEAYRPVTSGAFSLSEAYYLTVEAIRDMLLHLQPDGILMVSRWLQTPPSESIRLIATVIAAEEQLGYSQPGATIVAYRGIQTMTILVQPDGWSAEELAVIRDFTKRLHYDLVWAPDIHPEETNRFNLLPESVYYETVEKLLFSPDRKGFIDNYPFDISATYDDQPFFYHFFTWKQTPDLIATIGKTWQPFGGSGYFVLIALLVLVTVFSLVLIPLPLLLTTRVSLFGMQTTEQRFRGVGFLIRVMLYFGLLGIGFIFIEIPLIQRFILLFGHPIYAFTIVVFVLLIFSSLGSMLAGNEKLPRRLLFTILLVGSILMPTLSQMLVKEALGWYFPWQVLVSIICLAPMAILMGLPFPIGVAWIKQSRLALIPWAWAVNGCTSVIAGVLAAILALDYGFSLVLYCGALAYLGAYLTIFKDL